MPYRGEPYDESYFEGEGSRPEGYPDYGEWFVRHEFANTWADDIESETGLVSGKRILHVGCGYGHLTAELDSRGADITGVDMSSWAISQATSLFPTVDFQNSDIFATTFSDDTFDLIICIGVIECMENNTQISTLFATKLRPALKSDGAYYFLIMFDETNPIYINRTPVEWGASIAIPGKTLEITDVGHLPVFYKTRVVVT